MLPISNPTDLHQLMTFISGRYRFTADQYPSLVGANDDQRKAFAVSHTAHHMSKSLGKLSGECETFDHGGVMNNTVLQEGTVKMFINIIKLAEELGITAEELGAAVPDYMRST